MKLCVNECVVQIRFYIFIQKHKAGNSDKRDEFESLPVNLNIIGFLNIVINMYLHLK